MDRHELLADKEPSPRYARQALCCRSGNWLFTKQTVELRVQLSSTQELPREDCKTPSRLATERGSARVSQHFPWALRLE
ncbi:hypothetical protein BaRGS_00037642 [Batillaria attramentaria]|uniref:Uncharacterized protein n=1 Tax=Batillaria attramentaria TaxID=370345 RepID=A0ABD0J8L1_9CAEN